MNSLEDYRNEIDSIDEQMTKLFEQRMNVVLKVVEFKKKNNLQVLQKSREEQVIQKVVSYLNNKEYSQSAADFITQVMRISRDFQKQQLVLTNNETETTKQGNYSIGEIGFQGTAGSFSEEALIQYFGKNAPRVHYAEFEDVFIALQKGEIQYGILPIENSYTGGISAVYDLLEKYGFFITGEICIPIRHHLIGIKGTSLATIKEVYSHSQGFEQSTEFLSGYKSFKLIPYQNTAVSAEFVSKCNDISKAAIASKRAVEIYNLTIINENIQNKNDNSTRFIIVRKDLIKDTSSDKVSVVFSMDHKAGTLYSLLSCFAENQLNLVKIESRPKKDNPWTYYLYVDFEGSINSANTQNALAKIQQASAYFRILGCYNTDSNQ